MVQVRRHKVFVSYHHEQDQNFKDRFTNLMKDDMIDRSVKIGDIDSDNNTEEVRRQIPTTSFLTQL